MTRNQKTIGSILAAALVLASAVAIFSQQRQPAPDTMVFQRELVQGPDGPPRTPYPGDDTFLYVSSEMSFEGKIVKGAPYSAQAVMEMTQTLADGNRIVNKSTVAIYRDSEGRTRREQTLRAIGPFATAGEPPQTIFINDPVAGVGYVLDARTHVAREMPSSRWEYRTPAPATRVRMPAPPDAHAPAIGVRLPAPPEGPAPATGVRIPVPPEGPATAAPPGSEGKPEVFTVTVPRSPGGETQLRMKRRGDESDRTKSEPLGKKNVEGVEAEGMRATVTIPVGEIGNDRPIEIVSERWYSPELQTVVMTRHSDPRFGENVYRLMNINRGEQPKSLFEVPADYTVKSTSMGIGSGVGGGVGSGIGSGSGTTIAPGANPALKAINGGVLNGKAISLPLPVYPPIALAAKASGSVTVQITIDEDGNVISAQADSGHPLLRAAAVTAAREAKFSPTRLSGQPVKVQGVVIYNFSPE